MDLDTHWWKEAIPFVTTLLSGRNSACKTNIVTCRLIFGKIMCVLYSHHGLPLIKSLWAFTGFFQQIYRWPGSFILARESRNDRHRPEMRKRLQSFGVRVSHKRLSHIAHGRGKVRKINVLFFFCFTILGFKRRVPFIPSKDSSLSCFLSPINAINQLIQDLNTSFRTNSKCFK